VLLINIFIKIKITNGKTEIIESSKKLFLKPVVLISEITNADITAITIPTYLATDKLISSFSIIKDVIEFKINTLANVDSIIFTK
jgi:hypothetical protein